MKSAHSWLGALLITIPFAVAACGDDEDDGGGDGDGTTGGRGGSTGGSVTGGRGGSSGQGGATTGGRSTGGRGGTTTGGAAGAGEGGSAGEVGGMGGDDGGMGGEAGDPQGGSAGAGMGGTGGAVAGGGMGGAGSGGLAGGGVGGAGSGGLAGGGMAGGGMAGTGGVAPTCDPNPAPEIYVGVLSGAAEVPPVTTTATGFVVAQLNAAATELTSSVYWSGLSADVSNGHIHGPAPADMNGPPIFFYFGNPPTLPTSPSTTGSVVGMTFPIATAQQLADLRAGLYYANIHSTNNTGGEIRGQLVRAAAIRSGNLVGAQEVPPVTTTATGRAVLAVFPGNTYASVSVSWTGLTMNTSAGHIHGPAPAGMVANPPIFDLFSPNSPPAATSGSVVHRIWTMTGNQPTELLGGLHYANIHSTMHPTGEIRAQLLPPCP